VKRTQNPDQSASGQEEGEGAKELERWGEQRAVVSAEAKNSRRLGGQKLRRKISPKKVV